MNGRGRPCALTDGEVEEVLRTSATIINSALAAYYGVDPGVVYRVRKRLTKQSLRAVARINLFNTMRRFA